MPGAGASGEAGMTTTECRDSSDSYENTLRLNISVLAQLCEYIKNQWPAHFKRVHFMAHELYPNKTCTPQILDYH